LYLGYANHQESRVGKFEFNTQSIERGLPLKRLRISEAYKA
jgi:hypothetical protein